MGKYKNLEDPYFDKNGQEIKEFSLIKLFHFTGRNKRGNGKKHYYMYKWVRLKTLGNGVTYFVGYSLSKDISDKDAHFHRLAAVANKERIIEDAEILG